MNKLIDKLRLKLALWILPKGYLVMGNGVCIHTDGRIWTKPIEPPKAEEM